MDAREQRGLVIAAVCKLNRTADGWQVPSQSTGEKIYTVDPIKQSCTCPDHAENGHKCKHIYAVEYTIKREIGADGKVRETQAITFTEEKVYKQDWPAYNQAQSMEKERFQQLLDDLCRGVQEPDLSHRVGRKPHPIKDMVFSAVFKVYSTFSSRRFATDLREAHERGYLLNPIPGVKVNSFLEKPELTPILHRLIAESAKPLAAVETEFAVDSSGFSSSKFVRWYDEKYGVTRQKAEWVKAHIACGVKTNVVTAVRILDKDAGDHPQFGPLVKATRENFTVNEVSADKAYASEENFTLVAECGGTGFIAFKSNTTGGIGGLFEKMFHYFQFRRDDFLAHYHKRSNVESTFSAVKRKFGDSVRSKCDVAMVNEVLCKLLCHNLCCLIQEHCELGIEPVFWTKAKPAASLAVFSPVA